MSKVLNLESIISPDTLATRIADKYVEWELYRSNRVQDWKESHSYVFATDTSQTTNAKLPWSNKTTIPKLCQIRDNLYSNYMATMFPRRKWTKWVGDDQESESRDKKQAIEYYMDWVNDRNEFFEEIGKLVTDYIDYGNAFGTVEWVDRRTFTEDGREQVGFAGPVIRRISPLDIVFNPTSPSFVEAPKIIRSFLSLGEIKELMERESITEEDRIYMNELLTYMKEVRGRARSYDNRIEVKDKIYQIAGFSDYKSYLESNYVEVLTFYGDLYDEEQDIFYRNQVIKVVDRHRILTNQKHPSSFGHAPIFHVGWRVRTDNLWAMGPLENLVGMQYRIDHLENMKSDVFDLIAYPPLKIKGYVESFTWGPMEEIYVGDDGDVELMSPDVMALQADTQIAILEQKMEEMAGSPKEAMGFRTPGEKTKYEVQRLENAASRIFESRIGQFERMMTENLLNAQLELARRNMTESVIRVFNNDLKTNTFRTLNAYDITGNGRIKPVAARHFAEKANTVQNLTSFFGSVAGQDPNIIQHFSGERLARMWEQLLDIEDQNIVESYVRIAEQADAQRIAQQQEEEILMESQTPTGLTPEDSDLAF